MRSLLLATLLSLPALGAPGSVPIGAQNVEVSREAWVMGTRLAIHVDATTRNEALDVAELVLSEVERVEALLSTWSPTSELSRLNRAPVGRSVLPSPEVGRWLAAVAELSRRTERAFDPVVGALVDAWDLRGAGRVPTRTETRHALLASGPDGVGIGAGGRVERRAAGAWIDAGGFGKGAALGAVAALVDTLDDALDARVRVDLGGQLWLSGADPCRSSVHVAHPERRSEVVRRLIVDRGSVATSGTSERGVEIDGRRIGHILDPRSGVPVDSWGSVTVVASDPLEVDALSTGLYVMGPVMGVEWATSQGVAALFLVITGSGLSEARTPAMDAYDVHHPEASFTPRSTQLHNSNIISCS